MNSQRELDVGLAAVRIASERRKIISKIEAELDERYVGPGVEVAMWVENELHSPDMLERILKPYVDIGWHVRYHNAGRVSADDTSTTSLWFTFNPHVQEHKVSTQRRSLSIAMSLVIIAGSDQRLVPVIMTGDTDGAIALLDGELVRVERWEDDRYAMVAPGIPLTSATERGSRSADIYTALSALAVLHDMREGEQSTASRDRVLGF